MKKEKKKWNSFKSLFSKSPEPPVWSAPTEHPTPPAPPTTKERQERPKEIFVIEPGQEETFSVDSDSNEVFVIEPAQGETFILESTEEDTVAFESGEKNTLIIEVTKEYEILGLDADATDVELKTRYRELMKQNHPDKGGDPKEFMKIRKAYLKVKEARAED